MIAFAVYSLHVVSFPDIPWNVMSATFHILQTWLQSFLWTTIYDDHQQISHSCECWNWERVDKKFNSARLNWPRNRILWGSLKSLLWIGYNQNVKWSGWENSFSCETPLEHDASLIFRRQIRLQNQLYQPIPQHTHTHIGRYIMHCLPCVFGHFQFISSQRSCLLTSLGLSDWCFGDLNDVTLVDKESCQLSNRDHIAAHCIGTNFK